MSSVGSWQQGLIGHIYSTSGLFICLFYLTFCITVENIAQIKTGEKKVTFLIMGTRISRC